MEAIGTIVCRRNPDFIAFQEVTKTNLQLLMKQDWFSTYQTTRTRYDFRYFTVILSKKRIDSEERKAFDNSTMARDLLSIDTSISLSDHVTVPLTVATSHLESLPDYTFQREQQLAESLGHLASRQNVVFTGDMNIENKIDGQVHVPAPWCDAWPVVNGLMPEENGHTWNPRINTMIPRRATQPNRLDRMFVSLSDFTVKRAELVGNEPFDGDLFPSDHFGLLVEFEAFTNGLKGKSEFKIENISNSRRPGLFERPPNWKKYIG